MKNKKFCDSAVFDEIDTRINNDIVRYNNVTVADSWDRISSVISSIFKEFDVDVTLDDLVSTFISSYNRKAMRTKVVRDSKTDKQYIVLTRQVELDGDYEEVCRCEMTPEVANFMHNLRQLAYLDYDLRQEKVWKEEVE